ncbi:hypothetical protein OC846_000040 [Tilletia horrida]|uniref:GCF C-terminal domain-containing protein n=1 Tax=Tilletia horrida TaxID=155126 RepID=A0AAN6JXC4_9BASI|nr:hypothetical protein OC846_000040 [Tilletia horrida]KAK0569185.1 hypothetical protein OC861_001221 [Tilletia horrida]
MDVDDDRPPSPPAPSFVKRSKLRGARSAAGTPALSSEASSSTVGALPNDPSRSSRRAGSSGRTGFQYDDEDDDNQVDGDGGPSGVVRSSSAVVRSKGFDSASKRNRLKGTQSLMPPAAKVGAASNDGSRTILAGALPTSAPTEEESPRPGLAKQSTGWSSKDLLSASAADDAESAEDFIPIRTRRAPAEISRLEQEVYRPMEGAEQLGEEVFMPVYENQEALPDPGPIEDFELLAAGQKRGLSAQPTRLDEPQLRPSGEAPKNSSSSIPAMKEESELPSMHAASTRIAALLESAESALKAHETIFVDSGKSLEALIEEEQKNKQVVSEAGDKEAWFRELEEFIGNVARFLDVKMPLLEAVERDNIAIAAQRTRLVQRARAKDAEDELALFHGIPAISLLPARSQSEDQSAQETMATTFLSEDVDDTPSLDGPALSPTREARRAVAAQRAPGAEYEYEYELAPADRIAYQDARGEVYAQSQKILRDVLAPEFLDPAATIEVAQDDGDGDEQMNGASASESRRRRFHPASLVSRFHAWRERYPEEYMGSWGGLALAGAWEFWCRHEMAEADYLQPARKFSSETGVLELSRFAWHQRIGEYVAGSKVGGDDEAMEAMLGNVIVPRLVALAEGGGFDPWSRKETAAITHLVGEIMKGVDPKAWRYQSLVTAYVAVYRLQISTLMRAVHDLTPVSPPVAIHTSIPTARLSFLERLASLLENLVRWAPLLPESERGDFMLLVDDFLGRGIWPLLVAAKELGSGRITRAILATIPTDVLTPELHSRLSSFASVAP